MDKLLSWVRWGIRALLIFIAVTSALGASCWMVERYSIRDLVAVALVGFGWLAIGYAMCTRGRPRAREDL
ncbi:hypothetical protein GWC77_25915 [Paraburkholderia sp. NMBU_R16]|uniref:hypothetical protein n=1 Tax=Paraburkholderia sp. NMBU_R16 TaxID=2698676 RepID=UPI00156515E0|nr:hypothetical protein [Paraburkholderia sp. NMBU_R16]NRO99327.1 hypothetical protein [Paraburkholderia sp. NMBU_R16]